MKKLFAIVFLSLLLFSCQDEDRRDLMSQPETEKVPDSIQVLTGDFVYGADAAVIRGKDFVYEVKIDSMSKNLAKRVAPFKNDDFDMIPVTVKAKILPNPKQRGLNEIIEIREIMETPQAVKDTIEN